MAQSYLVPLIALLLTGLLAYQAVRAERGSRLRQTYGLAAGGFGLILALNLLWSFEIGLGPLGNAISFAAVAMLVGAVATYALAVLNGEFSAKIRQATAFTASERARYARERDERERSSGARPSGDER
jgi:hypothetical protein